MTDGRAVRGIALLVTMMASLILVGLVGALVPLVSTETAVVANHRRSVQALYAVEAGLEWVVGELGRPASRASWDAVLAGSRRSRFWAATLEPSLADGTVVDLRAATVELRRVGAGDRAAGRGLDWRLFAHGPLAAIVPVAPGYSVLRVAVWVADDAAETDQDPTRDSNGTLVVHAAAFGPGRAERAAQATVVRVRPTDPAPGATPSERVQLLSWRVVR